MRSLRRSMGDFLDLLAEAAVENIESGYYNVSSATKLIQRPRKSLKEAILGCRRAAIISEIKFSSPSSGFLRTDRDVEGIARDMVEAGVVGISILTEPRYFSGSLETLAKVSSLVNAPILMKDIILSRCQIDAAYILGADAVLLIMGLFKRGYCEIDIESMINFSHELKLEVLLEVHDIEEFRSALSTDADMIGINNRDLRSFKVDINTTKNVLEKFSRVEIGNRPIISESGIRSPDDVRFLRRCGVDAFLVGTAIMSAVDIREFVASLVNAYEESQS
ncbi:MAG: indole-3-glycerol-phosphate synthase [Candidatus Bathyarchaeia archaeon]